MLGEFFLDALKFSVSVKRRRGNELSPSALLAGVLGVEGPDVREGVCGFCTGNLGDVDWNDFDIPVDVKEPDSALIKASCVRKVAFLVESKSGNDGTASRSFSNCDTSDCSSISRRGFSSLAQDGRARLDRDLRSLSKSLSGLSVPAALFVELRSAMLEDL